jgi:hypothetical protein
LTSSNLLFLQRALDCLFWGEGPFLFSH